MKYKHIIWDWNGTLLDDVWLSVEVFNTMMQNYGLGQITKNYYRKNFRFPVIDFYKCAGFDFSQMDFEQVGNFFIDTYNARRYECRLFDGVPEIMQKLNDGGTSQSVLSASRKDHLKEAIEHHGIEKFLLSSAGLEDIYANSKEALGVKHVEKINVPRENILMVGDTDHDLLVAQTMGVNCVLMSAGHFSQDRLEKLDVPVLNSFDELAGFLEIK